MEEDKKIPYFLLGLGLGVAVGILFAPKSGEETRQLLKSKTDEGKEYVKRRTNAVLHDAEELVERGKRTVERQKEQLASAVEAGRQAYRESVATPPAPAPTADDLIEGV
jgi:gas vesicle protein